MDDGLGEVMYPGWGREADDPVDAATERAVVDAIEVMREKLGEHITIDDLARAARFSRFHFSRAFHRITGMSPGRFLSAMRIQEAKRLLLSSPRPVAEVARLVGYPGADAFVAGFSEAVGLPPGEYRRLKGFPGAVPRDCHRWMPAESPVWRAPGVSGAFTASAPSAASAGSAASSASAAPTTTVAGHVPASG
ncbi:helix-turn-helix domain-containing protein [Actinomadura terrae]|uniref:helix-turn-helix domain-containing protein n=1 Tax=Actinomadura terrae TaxID=604353 RepID=UPI001FA7945A|nr:AraC family transcriptional regulator [Actinomadura terrae]